MATGKRKRKGERPDGLIQVTLDLGRGPDGKRIRKSFYGHSRAEAERKRDEYKAHINSGSHYSRDISVGEWTRIFMDTYRQNVDPAGLARDDIPYNRLIADFEYRPMVSITEADLQASINKLAGTSFSNCDKYRQAIKRVFSRARKNKILIDDPSEDLALPPHTRGTHRALEPWEIQHILAHWHDDGLRGGLWVLLMLFCGLRRGELIALDWSAVDMKNRLLHVEQTAVIRSNLPEVVQRAKSAAGIRTIPIATPLYDALAAIPAASRRGPICLSAHGKRLSESAFSRGLETFCASLERLLNGEPLRAPGMRTDLREDETRILFSFRAHDLRHTFATMLYDSGMDVKTAAYLLGHADIRVTMDIYTHLSREKQGASEQMMLSYLDALPAKIEP